MDPTPPDVSTRNPLVLLAMLVPLLIGDAVLRLARWALAMVFG